MIRTPVGLTRRRPGSTSSPSNTQNCKRRGSTGSALLPTQARPSSLSRSNTQQLKCFSHLPASARGCSAGTSDRQSWPDEAEEHPPNHTSPLSEPAALLAASLVAAVSAPAEPPASAGLQISETEAHAAPLPPLVMESSPDSMRGTDSASSRAPAAATTDQLPPRPYASAKSPGGRSMSALCPLPAPTPARIAPSLVQRPCQPAWAPSRTGTFTVPRASSMALRVRLEGSPSLSNSGSPPHCRADAALE